MIRHVRTVGPDRAPPRVAEIYQQVRREMGVLAPPVILHAPCVDLLAGVWITLRETVLAGRVKRAWKEAVASAVSRVNQCPYCVDVHAMMLHATARHDVARQIADGNTASIRDPQWRAIVEWAMATRRPDAPELARPPFAAADAPELVGTAVAFHYINRMVSVFLGETPMPTTNRLLKRPLRRLAGWWFGGTVQAERAAGESLSLLPDAKVPHDLAWTRASPTVAAAFARLHAVVTTGAHAVMPEPVREALATRIGAWDGREPGMSRAWLEQACAEFEESWRPVARVALLTAFAPYQVSDADVAAFRSVLSRDEELLAVTAWAAYAAARRVASWVAGPFR